jgi:hypothetical protein
MRTEFILQYSFTSLNNISYSNHAGRRAIGQTKSTELPRVPDVRSEKQVKDMKTIIYNSPKRQIILYII